MELNSLKEILRSYTFAYIQHIPSNFDTLLYALTLTRRRRTVASPPAFVVFVCPAAALTDKLVYRSACNTKSNQKKSTYGVLANRKIRTHPHNHRVRNMDMCQHTRRLLNLRDAQTHTRKKTRKYRAERMPNPLRHFVPAHLRQTHCVQRVTTQYLCLCVFFRARARLAGENYFARIVHS